ncbi:hypothetical protein FRC04_005976 [Tulasnella sp. 424]|nr:hypothetical protein FRC04_005976 [Tulasnella sp. 424]
MGAHIYGNLRLHHPIWTHCQRRGIRIIRYASSVTSPNCVHDVLTLNIITNAEENAFTQGDWTLVRGEILGGSRSSYLDVEVFDGGIELSTSGDCRAPPVISLAGRLYQRNYDVYSQCVEIEVNTSRENDVYHSLERGETVILSGTFEGILNLTDDSGPLIVVFPRTLYLPSRQPVYHAYLRPFRYEEVEVLPEAGGMPPGLIFIGKIGEMDQDEDPIRAQVQEEIFRGYETWENNAIEIVDKMGSASSSVAVTGLGDSSEIGGDGDGFGAETAGAPDSPPLEEDNYHEGGSREESSEDMESDSDDDTERQRSIDYSDEEEGGARARWGLPPVSNSGGPSWEGSNSEYHPQTDDDDEDEDEDEDEDRDEDEDDEGDEDEDDEGDEVEDDEGDEDEDDADEEDEDENEDDS